MADFPATHAASAPNDNTFATRLATALALRNLKQIDVVRRARA